MDFRHPIQSTFPGVRGKVLAALAGVDGGLTLRQLAGVADVSVSQASSVIAALVELGVLHRRDVGSSALLTINPRHMVGEFVLRLSDLQSTVVAELARAASRIRPAPEAIIVFGSVARRTAIPTSDLDVLVVRPESVAIDDFAWDALVADWMAFAEALTGNAVNRIEVEASEVAYLRTDNTVWADIEREGIVVVGDRLSRLGLPALADASA